MKFQTIGELKNWLNSKSAYLSIQEMIDMGFYDDTDCIENFWDNRLFIEDSEILNEEGKFSLISKISTDDVEDSISGEIWIGYDQNDDKLVAADMDCGFYAWNIK